MMQLKASSPNLMVHQQGFVQLFLPCVQGVSQNCKQLASVLTRFMRSILTLMMNNKNKETISVGVFQRLEKGQNLLATQNLTNPKPS
jgi:hypothetical protein